MFKTFITLFFIAVFFNLSGQESWSLERCIQYAMDNNIRIKQSELNEHVSRNQLTQSKADLFPSLNSDAGYNVNFGRSIDPTTYNFVNEQIQVSSISLSSGVTLFNGLNKINTLKMNQFELIANQYATEDISNSVALNITSAYLQILLNKEELQSIVQRLELSAEQSDQTKKLVDAGVVPEGNLLDILAQSANDTLSYVIANNMLELSKLNLALLLQLDDPSSFDIITPQISILDMTSLEDMNPYNLYNTALGNQPAIKSSDYNLRSAERQLSAMRGIYYPTLSMFYNLRSNHSSIGIRKVEDDLVVRPPIGTVDDGSGTIVRSLTDFSVPVFEESPFRTQYQDNLNQTVGFSLSIPIFNGLRTRTAVGNAELQLLNARYNDQLTKDQLKNDVYIAYADAKAAFQTYRAASKNVTAMERSFQYVEQKFNLGAANNLEYSTASTSLAGAQIAFLKSKYDYIFKMKVLDFYLGNPITLN